MDVSVLQKHSKSGGAEEIIGVYKTSQLAQDAAEELEAVKGIRWASSFGMSFSINDARIGTQFAYTIIQFRVQGEDEPPEDYYFVVTEDTLLKCEQVTGTPKSHFEHELKQMELYDRTMVVFHHEGQWKQVVIDNHYNVDFVMKEKFGLSRG